jgi:hypothetical protein
MKKLLAVCFITMAVCLAANAQSKPSLPNNLTKYVGKYPDDLMKVASVKNRLKTLLGKNYSKFYSYINVQSPMSKSGDFIFGSGCLPHSCTISEAAFAIDVKNKRVHAVIYSQNVKPKYFNEDNSETPQVILDWVKDLQGN